MTHASVLEQWKPIQGYDGYQVSNLGRVRKHDYGIMSPHKNNSGYLIIGLRNNDGKKQCLVHRIVAKAFIPNTDNLPFVNHKNEVKTDNRADNLEWCTNEYNCNYGGHNAKLSASHLNHPSLSMPVIATDKNGTTIEYPSANEAARQTGIGLSNIVRCCNGEKYYHTAGGYKWKYKDK